MDDLQRVVDICLDEEDRGLFFSANKSLVWSSQFKSGDLDPLGRGVRRHESPGTVMLGAPIGTVEFEREILQARIGKIEGVLAELASLEDPHDEFALLRTGFSLPKLYALRKVNPARHSDILTRFDESIRASLESRRSGDALLPSWFQGQDVTPIPAGGTEIRQHR